MESADKIKESIAENFAIKEMIETETSFNTTLQFLETILAMDGLVKNIPVLVEFKKIIPQLKNISDKLLVNVKEALGLPDQHPDRNRLKEQRTQLLKAFFQVYPLCSQLYLEYVQGEAGLSGSLQDIKKYVSQNNTLRLDLNALLIQPVQRGPRYAMLIAAAISYNDSLIIGHSSKLTETQIAALKDLFVIVQHLLIEANNIIPSLKEKEEEIKPYEFGDISRGIAGMIGEYLYREPMPQEQVTEVITPVVPVAYENTRRALSFFYNFTTSVLATPKAELAIAPVHEQKPENGASEEDGFTFIPS